MLFQAFRSSTFFRGRFPVRTSSPEERQRSAFRRFFARCARQLAIVNEQAYVSVDKSRFAAGMVFTKLFWIFVSASFMGSVFETVWCLLEYGRFEMRTSIVYGFMIPIYGFGAVALSLLLYKFQRFHSFWIFLGGAVIGGAVEYAAALFQEIVYKTRSWDYSDTPLSIQGRTNLLFMLIWGVLGVVWIKFLYPLLSCAIEKIPKKWGFYLTVLLSIFLAFEAFLTTAALYRQLERQKGEPPGSAFEQFLDRQFHDEFLRWVYPNMKFLGK